jgi:hypothetical protein
MTTALQEIVERYEQYVTAWHNDVQTLAESPHFSDAENCPGCFFSRSLISRARAELERGVYPYDILTDYNHHMRNLTLMPDETASFDMAVDCMARALRDAGVRVVEDGKESGDG